MIITGGISLLEQAFVILGAGGDRKILIQGKEYLLLALFVVLLAFGKRVDLTPAGNPPIPVVSDMKGAPLFEAHLDGKGCFFRLATSSDYFVKLTEKGLELLDNKTPQSKVTFRDTKGSLYDIPTYGVRSLTFGNMQFSDLLAIGTPSRGHQSTSLWTMPYVNEEYWPQVSGEVGWPFVQTTNLLLDFGHNAVIPLENAGLLEKEGFSLDSMQRCPLEPNGGGLVITLNTEVGPLRFEIDTATTVTCVRPSIIEQWVSSPDKVQQDCHGVSYFSTDLSIGNTNLGQQIVYVHDIGDGSPWRDGCLGMDFLAKHVVYISYFDQAVYISKAT